MSSSPNLPNVRRDADVSLEFSTQPRSSHIVVLSAVSRLAEVEEDGTGYMSAENVNSRQQAQAGPSEQDAQALVEQLRTASAEEILTEVLSTLLSTAQVKLGRNDARLFIDLCAVLLDHAKGFVSDVLRGQVDVALGQLRINQVAAEREVAAADEHEPNDPPRTPSPPATEGRRQDSSAEPPGPPSGLWVPGR